MPEEKRKYLFLIKKLKEARNLETLINLFSALLAFAGIILLFIILASFVELVMKGDSVFRGVLAALLLLSSGGVLIYLIYKPLLRLSGIKYKPSVESVALRVGEHYPQVKDQLCNSIQLYKNLEKTKITSGELALAAFFENFNKTEKLDFKVIVERKSFKRTLLFFLISVIFTFTLFSVFNSSIGSAFYRVVNFNRSFLPPAPFSLSIEPKEVYALRGENVKIIIRAKGKAPETVTLMLREEQQENYDALTLKADSNKTYTYELKSIKRSLVFFAESPWLTTKVKTDEGKINVTDKPLVKSMNGNLSFPSYTRLQPRQFNEQNADLTALTGSTAAFTVFANKQLKSAQIIFEKLNTVVKDSLSGTDTLIFQMKTDGNKCYGSFSIRFNGQYYIRLTDKEGLQNTQSIKYSVVALDDEYPSIAMLVPNFDVQLSEEAMLPLKVQITDDYGFSALKLNYRLTHSKFGEPSEKFTSISLPFLGDEKSLEVPYLWDLNKIDITPEDKYEYYIEVFDNDRVKGPKSARTQLLTVRLPSLDEVLQSADEGQKKIEKDLEKVLKQAEEIKKDAEQLNRELLKNQTQKNLDWKEKKKAEDLLKKQAELQSKMSDIKQSLDQITKNLEENKALSPETLEKYQELQKLMQEVQSPELKRMQEAMKNLLDKISPEEMQKMMKNYKFNEEQFRKSIERTLKILKRLQAEQKVDALTKRAEELQKNQDELQKKMENTNPADKNKRRDLADEQKKLGKDLKKISEELKELDKLMKDIGDDMPRDELQKAEESLNEQETSDNMEQSEQAMEQGDFQKSGKNQKNASKNLKSFAQNMKKLKQDMENKNMKEAQRKLQKALSDMLALSKKQESLKNKTQNADAGSTQINQFGEEQASMEDALTSIANSMYDLGEKSFAITPEMGQQVGMAMQNMQDAVQSLAGRQSQQASNSMGQAMAAMNNAAMQMQAMISNMQNNGSCSNPGGMNPGGKGGQGAGMMERLQQLAQQQQGINNAMQQMAGKSGQLSPEQQAQFGRIVSEQGKAQKSMDELAKEQKQFTGPKQGLGDLQKIADEMKEVVSDMKNGQITPETMKRQDRILSRLLDATKAINERDYEKKRESKTGKEFNTQSPGELDPKLLQGNKKAFDDLLKSIQQGYTKDYEELIRQYFDALQKNGQKF